MEDLEVLVATATVTEAFIKPFLRTYGIPNATLNRADRNIAIREGDFGIPVQCYFRAVKPGVDLFETLDALLTEPIIDRHRVRFVLVTDFWGVAAHDRKVGDRLDCNFADLARHYSFFLPLAGYEKAQQYSDSPADARAAEKIGKLCDLLRDHNDVRDREQVQQLHVFLTRLLFCLFADDTDIFAKQLFNDTLKANTRKDGTDTAEFLRALFRVLNEPERTGRHPAQLEAFPYVNGALFADDIPVPALTGRARRLILEAGDLDWSGINPDIFGSMFQSVLDAEQRGALGQHYTSYSNIMKVLRPLFLDDLEAELEAAKTDRRGAVKRLNRFLDRLSRIKVFDPACGCGNFLIVAYKELRRLEMAAQQAKADLSGQEQAITVGVRLENFFGIEIDDFAHETAQLSLWLTQHQMNKELFDRFGQIQPTLPLTGGGQIVLGNALQKEWTDVCPRAKHEEVYVCGNPPFAGSKNRDPAKTEELSAVFSPIKGVKDLDYVTGWFWKSAQYIQNTKSECGFVATNSVAQGAQVSMLWPHLIRLGMNLRFAYQTFQWKNSARDNAGVHVVIIGISPESPTVQRLFKKVRGEWHESHPRNISPYILDGPETIVKPQTSPISPDVRPIVFGSMPNDGGGLILTPQEKNVLLNKHPEAEQWVKKLKGSDEFLKGKERWCLWLVNCDQKTIQSMPFIQERVENVRQKRLSSGRETTRELAKTPHLFGENRHPESGRFILVPRHTSENREYAPVGFFGNDTIGHDSCLIIPNGTLSEFSILCSKMHMDWLRLVGGRLESRYRYSGTMVYNTFPWPDITDQQRHQIESLGEEVLLAREDTPECTMAEMYDPDKMPDTLRQAHRNLDEAVERLYRKKPFESQAERQEYLLARYAELVKQTEEAI